ncbi:MAG: iron(III) transport system permease protein [Thermotogota bacterium]|nr:iron(III) transport system permease protein [Thermotogota bacterium]
MRFLSRLKDPWIVFSVVVLLILLYLMIVPAVRIIVASFTSESGGFQLATDANGKLEAAFETVKGIYNVSNDGMGNLVVTRKNREFLRISAVGPGKLKLEIVAQDNLSVESVSPSNLKITIGDVVIQINQEVMSSFTFSAGLFESTNQQEFQPLQSEKLDERNFYVTYTPGAYLGFKDSSLTFSPGNYKSFFSRRSYVLAVRNSLIVTMLTSIFATFLGMSLAYFYSKYDLPMRSTVISLTTLASISPPFLGAYAWRILLGKYGVITRLLHLDFSIVGVHGVIWVITWLTFPLVFLISYDAFTSIDPSLKEVSMSLGANRWRTFWKIEVPLAMPGILTGLYMAAMTAFVDFGTPYILSPDMKVLPVLVYNEFMNEVGSNPTIASVGSVVMILIASLSLMAQRIYLALKSFASISAYRAVLVKPWRTLKLIVGGFTALVLAIAFVPHITVLITSFLEWTAGVVTTRFTLQNYLRAFTRESYTVGITFFIGTIASVIAITIGVGIAYVIVRKRYVFITDALNILIMVPYIIPGTVLAIGLILLFNSPPLQLTGTWIILVIAYFVRKLPYSVKAVESNLYQVHPALEEAAMSLGARPIKTFTSITLRLIAGGLVSGATLTFLQIMTEVSATVVLYKPPWRPMTAVIFENAMRAGADYGVASAMTVILMMMLYVPLYYLTVRTRQVKGGQELANF